MDKEKIKEIFLSYVQSDDFYDTIFSELPEVVENQSGHDSEEAYEYAKDLTRHFKAALLEWAKEYEL